MLVAIAATHDGAARLAESLSCRCSQYPERESNPHALRHGCLRAACLPSSTIRACTSHRAGRRSERTRHGAKDPTKHDVVRARGVEPPRAEAHVLLRHARLPFRHARVAPRDVGLSSTASMVRVTGIEPARAEAHDPLRVARLPFRHTRVWSRSWEVARVSIELTTPGV